MVKYSYVALLATVSYYIQAKIPLLPNIKRIIP